MSMLFANDFFAAPDLYAADAARPWAETLVCQVQPRSASDRRVLGRLRGRVTVRLSRAWAELASPAGGYARVRWVAENGALVEGYAARSSEGEVRFNGVYASGNVLISGVLEPA